jgi:hypothetical protein
VGGKYKTTIVVCSSLRVKAVSAFCRSETKVASDFAGLDFDQNCKHKAITLLALVQSE